MKKTTREKYAALKGNQNAAKTTPKNRILHIRLTDADLASVELAAKKSDMTTTEYARVKILT